MLLAGSYPLQAIGGNELDPFSLEAQSGVTAPLGDKLGFSRAMAFGEEYGLLSMIPWSANGRDDAGGVVVVVPDGDG
jgi:hypothetical protein